MNTDILTQLASQDGAQYAWLRQSLNDFEMARILLASGKWDGACYHAQQTAKKLLKFILSHAGQAFRHTHTHSVHELAKEYNQHLDATLFDDEIIDSYKELSQYNTIARYPSAYDAPVDIITKKQALSAIDTLNQTLWILRGVYENR
ncbi:MAG: HEPN domain-containing protein [Methylococcaceae bacterium]|nr:HEPN domain-containing protein [Methylococcaceae bacterium]